MNSKWLKALLIISLVLNCIIAGGVSYKYLFGHAAHESRGFSLRSWLFPRSCSLFSEDARKELQGKLLKEREGIQSAQDRLMELLIQDTPDREKINTQLEALSKTQADVQHVVLDQILKELQTLNPEQKKTFLANLKERMRFKGMFGMGRGLSRGDGCQKKKMFPW